MPTAKLLYPLACLLAALQLTACSDPMPPAAGGGDTARGTMPRHQINAFYTPTSGDSVFISKDTANKMIGSYLTSIDYKHNDTSVKSYTFNADSVRAFLSDTSIKEMKVMMAHSLAYINQNGPGRNVGYNATALTLILSGINSKGDYVFRQVSKVPEHAAPCPSSCVTGGTGADDLFPTR